MGRGTTPIWVPSPTPSFWSCRPFPPPGGGGGLLAPPLGLARPVYRCRDPEPPLHGLAGILRPAALPPMAWHVVLRRLGCHRRPILLARAAHGPRVGGGASLGPPPGGAPRGWRGNHRGGVECGPRGPLGPDHVFRVVRGRGHRVGALLGRPSRAAPS